MTNSELFPYKPTHPGSLLKEELEARGISQKKFAQTINVSYTMLNEILNCHRPISADMALILEAALGIKAYIWFNLQSDYNIQTARADKTLSKRLSAIRKLCASVLP